MGFKKFFEKFALAAALASVVCPSISVSASKVKEGVNSTYEESQEYQLEDGTSGKFKKTKKLKNASNRSKNSGKSKNMRVVLSDDMRVGGNEDNKVSVSSEGALRLQLANNASDNLKKSAKSENMRIVLSKDIHIENNLVIDSSVDLDLNGHSLILSRPDVQISIGKRTVVGKIPYQVWHEGHSERRSKTVWYYDEHGARRRKEEFYDEWIPGYYTTEYKDQYEYDNDIKVNIRNGSIKGADAAEVEDEKSAYWYIDACGSRGNTPIPLFSVISGQLNFCNVDVTAGNGSNGGNATYAALWHVPFIGGGDGGNGGNGGNGGDLFFVDQGLVSSDSKSKLVPGKRGKGGKGSEPNPNYWLWSGSHGKDGKNGKNGKVINDESRLLIVE